MANSRVLVFALDFPSDFPTKGMYQRFHKVYSDMEKVNSLASLEHPASIQEFMKLMPADCRKKYVELS